MRVGVVAVCLGLGLQGCAHFECTAHGGSEVRALTSEHFVITSALPEAKHRELSSRLELLWDTFAAFFGAEVDHASIPVVMLESPAEVEHFASGYAGFVQRKGPEVLVVGAPGEDGAVGTTAHELTHLVSAYLLPRQPRWLAEGLATLFEDAEFQTATRVKMGRWNRGRAETASLEGLATLEELTAWGDLRFNDSEGRLYASAWAWVHYLANHDEARLKRLFAGLRSARPLDEVMREVLPPADATRLHGEIQGYLASARFRAWVTTLSRQPVVRQPRALSPWEVHALRAKLRLRDEEAARRELEQAVALAPVPHSGVAALLEAQLAKKPLGEVLDKFPSSPEVALAAWEETPDRATRAHAMSLLGEHPDNPSLLLVAADLAAKEGDMTAVAELVGRGRRLAPWSVEFASLDFELALAKHDCGAADLRFVEVTSLVGERMSDGSRQWLEKARTRLSGCGK